MQQKESEKNAQKKYYDITEKRGEEIPKTTSVIDCDHESDDSEKEQPSHISSWVETILLQFSLKVKWCGIILISWLTEKLLGVLSFYKKVIPRFLGLGITGGF